MESQLPGVSVQLPALGLSSASLIGSAKTTPLRPRPPRLVWGPLLRLTVHSALSPPPLCPASQREVDRNHLTPPGWFCAFHTRGPRGSSRVWLFLCSPTPRPAHISEFSLANKIPTSYLFPNVSCFLLHLHQVFSNPSSDSVPAVWWKAVSSLPTHL